MVMKQRKDQLPLSGWLQNPSQKSSPDYKAIFCVISLLSWVATIPFWLPTKTSDSASATLPPFWLPTKTSDSASATLPPLIQNLLLFAEDKPNIVPAQEIFETSFYHPLPSFTEILIASGSDKFHRHHYERYYENWLRTFRHKPQTKILEIGAEAGRSLKVWSDYFSYPEKIMGLAYGEASDGVEESSSNLKAVSVYRGDQSKKETMDYLISKGPWDIIIDDGSHVPSHMIFSLFSLWNSVKPGGLYIIEDLETNYWPDGTKVFDYEMKNQGIGAGPEYSTVSKIQQIQQVLISRRSTGAAELSVMPGDEEICAIEWGMNCVAIKRCSEKEATAYPPMRLGDIRRKVLYDPDRMKNWIEEARRTNPVV
jgi:hypothetical protein